MHAKFERRTCFQWRRVGRCLLLMPLVLLLSCEYGPRLGQVMGTVRLDGEPLPDATVIFQPTGGGPASHAITDERGQYELMYAGGQPGAVIGSHTVTVETYSIRLDEAGEPVESAEKVPARYNTQTQLSREVAAGPQTFDLNLSTQE